MLYRLFASIWGSNQPEVTVFFELPPGEKSASAWAGRLLGQMWHVPAEDVEIYNCWSEQELLSSYVCGPERTGDARLFETGSGGEDLIHYARPDHTLLLVQPATLLRLVKGQQFATALKVYHRTPRGQEELRAFWAAQLRQSQVAA